MSQGTPPSLDFLYEVVKGRIGDQNAQIATLDTKANFGVVSSTLLISGASSLRSAFATARLGGSTGDLGIRGTGLAVDPSTVVNWLTVAALVTFLVLVLCAYRAYQLRRYTLVPNLATLLDEYWSAPLAVTKADLVVTLADAFKDNEVLVRDKVWWTKAVLICLALQAGWLVLMALIQFAL